MADRYLEKVRLHSTTVHILAYHPIIVIGSAMVKRTFLVKSSRRKIFDPTATTSCTAFKIVNLWYQFSIQIRVFYTYLFTDTYHAGSETYTAPSTAVLGGFCCTQGRPKEQMLNANATGPRAPAIVGKTEEINHQRLE
jgi:hypothetical protein